MKEQPTPTEHGAAYEAVTFIYRKSPGKSWRRLSGALNDAMKAAITAHLSFEPDDFAAIDKATHGGYWMGQDSGERYYNLAVESGHTGACISFERFAARPAALWPEKVRTPRRLCIGSEFTWKGLFLTVTSMRKDHLIGCSYSDREWSGSEASVGTTHYLDGGYREVEDLKRLDSGALLLRMGAISPHSRVRKPDRVVRIPYEELAQVRKAADALRRTTLAEIAGAENLTALRAIIQRLGASPRHTYRHFDIDDFQKARCDREGEFMHSEVASARAAEQAEGLERWLAGENVHQYFSQVKLRVHDGYVETSTGQSVSLESAREMLPWVLKRRTQFGPVSGARVDLHSIRSISPEGVQIGCTLVPWPEVERLPAMLGVSA